MGMGVSGKVAYKNAAGPIRNQWMLKYGKPDLVLALPGGAGTASMIDLASKAGVPFKKAGTWNKL